MPMTFSDFLRSDTTTYDGTPMTSLSEAGMTQPGTLARERAGARYQENFDAARSLLDRVVAGDRRAALRFQEAMTMSDFSVYFGDVLDRSKLAAYAETPYVWSQFAKRARIRDFRQAKIFRQDRGASVLDGPILPSTTTGISGTGPNGLPELAEYPFGKQVITDYVDQIYKFGRKFGLSWETIVNDDLDMLTDFPMLMGRAARRTEEKRATQLFVSSGGPNSTFFTDAHKNLVHNAVNSIVTTENPVLSVTSLMWALTIMSSQLDLDGEPIDITGAVLVVPPALKYTAQNILRTSQIAMNDMGGTNNTGATGTSLQRLYAPNPFEGIVTLAVGYYLPIVNTTTPNTAWYVFASPNSGRPAMQLSFLTGHETPEMFTKTSNAVMLGGGAMVDPSAGDFDNDSVLYKERHCLGGTLLDFKMGVASSGAGS